MSSVRVITAGDLPLCAFLKLKRQAVFLVFATMSYFLSVGMCAPLEIRPPTFVEKQIDRPTVQIEVLSTNGALIGGTPLFALTNEFEINPSFNPPTFAWPPFAFQGPAKLMCKLGAQTDQPYVPFQPIIRLDLDGTRDETFDSARFSLEALSHFNTFAVLPDQKILLGFTASADSQPVYRLNVDGSLDSTFPQMGTLENDFFPLAIYGIVALADGKTIVWGNFSYYWPEGGNPQGHRVYGLARLNSDGIVDRSFEAVVYTFGDYSPPLGRAINTVVMQPDGKILVGGALQQVNGVTINNGLVRLLPNGTVDNTFPALRATVYSVCLEPDGKILVGGEGANGSLLVRLREDGFLDTSFFTRPMAFGTVYSIDIDEAGRIYANPSSVLRRYSGKVRVNVPAAEVPLVLERTYDLNQGWSVLETIPANTSAEYSEPDFLFPANEFFRTRPAQ